MPDVGFSGIYAELVELASNFSKRVIRLKAQLLNPTLTLFLFGIDVVLKKARNDGTEFNSY